MKGKKIIVLLIAGLLLITEGTVALADVNESTSILEENYEEQTKDLEKLSEEDANLDLVEIIEEEANDTEVEEEISNEDEVKTDEDVTAYANNNSTKGTAKTISLNSNNIFGITESYEYMWTKFVVPSDGYITVSIDKVLMGASEEKQVNLTIEDESGRNVYISTDSVYGGDYNSSSNKWTIGLAAGTYYMKLEAGFYISIGQYDLGYRVDFVKDSFFEKEINNSMQQSTKLTLSKTYKGILNEGGNSWSYDTDYYAVDIEGSNLSFKVKHNIDSEYYYNIYDSYGNYVQTVYEGDMVYEEGGIYKYILNNLVQGRYYIEVEVYNTVKKDWYELTVSEPRHGWVTEGGKTYYYNAGIKQTGFADINGLTYYFSNDGVMATGWKSVDDVWYFFNYSSGAMKKGWMQEGGKWYYLSPLDGAMYKGAVPIGNDVYFFKENGEMATNGWNQYYGSWYYLNSSGIAHKGWLKEGNTWYYFDEYYAQMATGIRDVRGTKYLFHSSGAMNTRNGWVSLYGEYYYANSDGTVRIGWLKDGGKWYYLDSYGVMATNFTYVNGSYYYLGSDGAMRTGWTQLYNYNYGKWYYYYFGSDGAMRTGWQSINGDTYYFIVNSNDAPYGAMVTGTWMIDYIWYYFDNNGILVW